ncbi:GNAT family N-acetyltransferase [Bacillus alkalicellulosilyticus]|uniref:GNAT family N-acetyltransferase n=1 Tax=Alkalihalobacterium alkalicellulosilyticum TaxID=1912214 RepID=UPI000996CD81|nr:GNAT family N-acetyltransferase [Bacillus alkalicellulosilyticus]
MIDTVTVRTMVEDDWDQVCVIYEEGIKTGKATFQQTVPSWEAWDKGHLKPCRLVACQNTTIVGWVALSPVANTCAYKGVAELSLYVKEAVRGQGVGDHLLKTLIPQSESDGFWTLHAGIIRENTASIRLHMKNGFREIGYRERVSKLNGQWRDVLLMERRSTVVGID